jgi:hypothetical protein
MGLKAEINPRQGRELHVLMIRLKKKRSVTKTSDKIKLDPVRGDFKEFIGNVCFDHLVNPLIPKESGKKNCLFIKVWSIVGIFFVGKSSHDFHKRVTIIAEQIRKIFFGEPLETTYFWSGSDPDAKPNEIVLPTLKGINTRLF